MKAICLIESGPDLVLADVPRPTPGEGEVLLQVCAAGATPAELSWFPTLHTKDGAARKGAVPGHEFSGIIEAVGEGIGSLEIGREVFGMNDWYAQGAMAEYCVAPFFSLASKPKSLTHAEAASVPISALTAWQGLFEHAHLKPGETVLVHGGSGGVGVYAVQLAKLHGARVIATASARNRDFVASLGADEVIDHAASRFDELLHGLDVVFDTVGGETLDRSWKTLGQGGRLVTIASSTEQSADPRVKEAFFIVEPNQKQLIEIGCLLDAGKLQPMVDSVVPLAEAPEALLGKTPRRGRGKVVIEVSTEKKGKEVNDAKHKNAAH